jgi:hypothetical protein
MEMDNDRRRVARHTFEAQVELVNVSSNERMESITSDVSTFGCFVKTASPFPKGTPVTLKVVHNGRAFKAEGDVVFILTDIGMGIAYSEIAPEDFDVIREWISQRNAEAMLAPD